MTNKDNDMVLCLSLLLPLKGSASIGIQNLQDHSVRSLISPCLNGFHRLPRQEALPTSISSRKIPNPLVRSSTLFVVK